MSAAEDSKGQTAGSGAPIASANGLRSRLRAVDPSGPGVLFTSFPGRCPTCCGSGFDRPTALPGLRVARCRTCGHRLASHDTANARGDDYHEQYDGGTFLESLRATRVRQAGRLIGLLRKHVRDLSGLLDFGAGQGWLLEACRSAGVAPIAGVDTSRLAVDGLKAAGIEAHLLPPDGNAEAILQRLSFRPRVLSLLDVIEHFPPERLEPRLRGIIDACGSELELVAVKVPVAGVLHAGAHVLSRLGAPKLLLQLYQTGTWPPHFNCFSTVSARKLLAAAGLSVAESAGDPDFEPECLAQRVGATGPAARALTRIAGEVIGGAVRISGRFDSAILLAKPVCSRGT